MKYDQTYREDMLLAFNLAMPLVLMNGDIDTILKKHKKVLNFYMKNSKMIKYKKLISKLKYISITF